jgi:hypothetical protein
MTNIFPGGSMPNIRGARRTGLLLLPVLAAIAVAVVPGALASPLPSSVTCAGKTSAVKGDTTQVGYAFHCSEDIKSYTVVSTKPIAGFDVNVNVFLPSGALDEASSWGCEGDIPGDGFNCNGGAPRKHVTKGQFEPEDLPCSTKNRWKSRNWVVVADVNGQTAGPFALSGPKKCKGPKPAKKRAKHARHHS